MYILEKAWVSQIDISLSTNLIPCSFDLAKIGIITLNSWEYWKN